MTFVSEKRVLLPWISSEPNISNTLSSWKTFQDRNRFIHYSKASLVCFITIAVCIRLYDKTGISVETNKYSTKSYKSFVKRRTCWQKCGVHQGFGAAHLDRSQLCLFRKTVGACNKHGYECINMIISSIHPYCNDKRGTRILFGYLTCKPPAKVWRDDLVSILGPGFAKYYLMRPRNS